MMHGGNWHRQVSLLSFEEITAFNEKELGLAMVLLGKT